MEKTIIIHESNLNAYAEKLAELNAKFSKKNLPLIVSTCTKEPSENDKEKTYEFTLTSEFNQTNLKGIDVKYEGVVSLVEQNESDRVYSFESPVITRILSNGCKCDECGKKIARNKYIVFSKVGKKVESREDLVVLGTSCAKNYVPFDVESYFLSLAYDFGELEEFNEFGGSYSYRLNSQDIIDLFTATVAVSDNLKVYEKEGVTKSNVFGWIANAKIDNYGNTYRNEYPLPQNPISWEDMKEWIAESFDNNEMNDFIMNARSAFYRTNNDGSRELRERIPNQFAGIAIYGFIHAKKNHDKMVAKKIAEEKRIADNAKVEYYGAVGDKFELTLTFDKSFGFEGAYGYQYILLFRDEENHVFVWKTANGNLGKNFNWAEYEVGQKYLIKGTVKSHDEYKNVKQTVITRCKVLDDFNKKEEPKDVVATVVDYEDPFETLMETMASVEQSA